MLHEPYAELGLREDGGLVGTAMPAPIRMLICNVSRHGLVVTNLVAFLSAAAMY